MIRQPIIKFSLLLIALTLAGLGCRTESAAVREATRPVELVWWRVFDDSDSTAQIIEAYRRVHPNISIIYRKLRYEEYEQELLNALAEDRGPDILTIHNTALLKYKSKLLPLPAEIRMAYQVVRGTIRKETVTELRTERSLRPDQVKNQFIDQVYDDVVLPYQEPNGQTANKIFGLPLALDTMVLYYNRDLLNSARIPEPARTWEEFLQQVKLLTRLDMQGNIVQAGATIGTAANIERASDVLSVIMMQNGTEMTQNMAISFNVIPPGTERTSPPGIEALRFYTDFADPTKEAYTWNSSMPNSLDAFTGGMVSYFFGYSYHLPIIRARAPKLNFGITKLPQIDLNNETNFANYWVEGVSAKTTHPDEAWDFVQFAARAQNVTSYLDITKKPTALRSLVSNQLENPDISVFASEVLTAKSWYHGHDPNTAEAAMNELIDNTVAGAMTIEEAINLAAGKVSQTLVSR